MGEKILFSINGDETTRYQYRKKDLNTINKN